MSVVGVNQSKTIVTPRGQRKAGIYFWGDSLATWGDSLATWGGLTISPTNQSRTPSGAVVIVAGSPMGLLLTLTYPTDITIGSGVINQPKS